MKIRILVDNHTLIEHYFEGEPGFSAYVEHDGTKTLFDLGYSDLFMRNACRMGIDFFDLDYVVLSHGHLDHAGGLFHLLRHYTHAMIEKRPFRVPALIAHPHALLPCPKPPLPDIGAWLTEEEIGRHLPLVLTKDHHRLGRDLLFLGEIPRSYPLHEEGRRIVLSNGTVDPDRLLDDTALA
ncbi:MAG: MBL fold metallo-hydrolase [Methanomicrobiales archaeon]|nr:MBL fold metallo-hydrolase [Methanomicrobiales archaeon]